MVTENNSDESPAHAGDDTNKWQRRTASQVAMGTSIAALNPEAQARLGIRNERITSLNIRGFSESFYGDLPEGARQYFGAQLEDILQNTEEGRRLVADLNAISPESREAVTAAEEQSTTQAAEVIDAPASTPDAVAARNEVQMAVTDQGLADQQTAAAVERIAADRRDGRSPDRADVAILHDRREAREDRMARRVATMTEPLPAVLQGEIQGRGSMTPRDIIREGRTIMGNEPRKNAALEVLRALEENPSLTKEELLQRGFSPEQIRDAAFLDAYAVARGITHIEDIVACGQELERGRGQGHDQQRDQGTGYTPPAERLIIKQAEIDVLMDGHLRFADADGSHTFNRADIDAAIAEFQRSGVVIDQNDNGRLDAAEIGRLESQLQQQAQQTPPSTGPVRG